MNVSRHHTHTQPINTRMNICTLPWASQFTGPIRQTQMEQKLTPAGQMQLIEKAVKLCCCNEWALNTIRLQQTISRTAVFVIKDKVKCYLWHKMWSRGRNRIEIVYAEIKYQRMDVWCSMPETFLISFRDFFG